MMGKFYSTDFILDPWLSEIQAGIDNIDAILILTEPGRLVVNKIRYIRRNVIFLSIFIYFSRFTMAFYGNCSV